MAQLFQPTNITPDTRGAFGNGNVVWGSSETEYIDVSWQVNGNTPMTAFQIDICRMDGSLIYSTATRTDNCPFYGTDYEGNVTRFTYSVPLSGSSLNTVRTAGEGLIRIVQLWGSFSLGRYVSQLSLSHFVIKENPTVTIPSQGVIESRKATFTGTITGASDGIMWMEWILKTWNPVTAESVVIKDTGKIYGLVSPSFYYDGYLPGDYRIELHIETSGGIQAYASRAFTVLYATEETNVPITAYCDRNGESAVVVRWARIQSIPLAAGNGMTDNGTAIRLANEDSYLIWDQVNGETMDLPTPWTAVWSGSVTPLSGRLFTIMTESGRYYEAGVRVSAVGTGQLYLESSDEGGTDRNYYVEAEWESGDLSCVLTQGVMYWKVKESNGTNVYPAETLLPSDSLLPGGLGGDVTGYHTMDLEGSGFPDLDNIVSVTLYGPSSVYSFEILDHTVTDVEAQNLLVSPHSAYSFESLFYLKPKGSTQDYNAGDYPETLRNWTDIEVYRMAVGSGILEYVGQSGTNGDSYGNQILDYAVGSQQGPYQYYLYVLSSNKYLNVPAVSGQINPCFWNWSVLSCKEENGDYIVESSYLFGKNLQSGSISNNNQPGIFQNFTPYPTVMIAPQNYQSGTLQSLIGVIKDGEYSDTIELRDAIYNLSTTTNALFLKNRKGDLLKIRPSGEITMETMDNTKQQALTVSFPWAEIGDASGVAIYGYGGAS